MKNDGNEHMALKESMSALMDGEHTEMDLHRVLKATESNEEARAVWSRYHMISAALDNDGATMTVDLSARIRSAIEGDIADAGLNRAVEVDSEIPETIRKRGWVGQMAVAASCAFVVLFGAQFADFNGNDNPAAVADPSLQSNSLPSSSADTQLVSLPGAASPLAPLARTVSSQRGVSLQGGYYTPVDAETLNVMSEQELEKKIRELMQIQAEQQKTSGELMHR